MVNNEPLMVSLFRISTQSVVLSPTALRHHGDLCLLRNSVVNPYRLSVSDEDEGPLGFVQRQNWLFNRGCFFWGLMSTRACPSILNTESAAEDAPMFSWFQPGNFHLA